MVACTGFSLGLLLVGCTSDPDEAQADASPDVVVADAAKLDVAPLPDVAVDVATSPDRILDTAGSVDTHATIDTLSAIDTQVPSDGAASPDARPACVMPSYSKNCAEVSMFECGFTAKCEGGVISISWHQHACNGDSWVSYYDCTYTCPKGCKSASVGWTSPGGRIVEETCNP